MTEQDKAKKQMNDMLEHCCQVAVAILAIKEYGQYAGLKHCSRIGVSFEAAYEAHTGVKYHA